jgi:hypothetical protein
VAKSIGFDQRDGNLYERFDDGTFVLKEAGYEARMDALVKKLNSAATVSPAAGTTISPTPPAVSSVLPVTSVSSQVKVAGKDIILFDEGSMPIDLMADLIFEDIGGQELISIARRDTVNGQKISYQPIKNLSSIEQQYNANNLINLQSTSDKYFSNFPIKLDDKIPNNPTGPNDDYVYIDPTTGDLIIETVNLEQDEQIEIQIATGGTIYEVNLNGSLS